MKYFKEYDIHPSKDIYLKDSLHTEIWKKVDQSVCNNKAASMSNEPKTQFTSDASTNKSKESTHQNKVKAITHLTNYCQTLNWMCSETINSFCKNEKDRIRNKIEESKIFVYYIFTSDVNSFIYRIPFLKSGKKVIKSKDPEEKVTYTKIYVPSHRSNKDDTDHCIKQNIIDNNEDENLEYQEDETSRRETKPKEHILNKYLLISTWELLYKNVKNYFTLRHMESHNDISNDEVNNINIDYISSNITDDSTNKSYDMVPITSISTCITLLETFETDRYSSSTKMIEELTSKQKTECQKYNRNSHKNEEIQFQRTNTKNIPKNEATNNNLKVFQVNKSWNHSCVGTTCSFSFVSLNSKMVLIENKQTKDHDSRNFSDSGLRTYNPSINRCACKEWIPFISLKNPIQPMFQTIAVLHINDSSLGLAKSYIMDYSLHQKYPKCSSECHSKLENTEEIKLLEDSTIDTQSKWWSFLKRTKEYINEVAVETYQYKSENSSFSNINQISEEITEKYAIFKDYIKNSCISIKRSIGELYALCYDYSSKLLENLIYYWCLNTKFKKYLKKIISFERYVIFMCGVCITYILCNFTHIITTFSMLHFLFILFMYFIFSFCLYCFYCLFVSPKSSFFRFYRFCYKAYTFILRTLKFRNVRFRLFKFSVSFWRQPTMMHIKTYKDQWLWVFICFIYIQCFIIQLIFNE